jgi:hypothetical protein
MYEELTTIVNNVIIYGSNPAIGDKPIDVLLDLQRCIDNALDEHDPNIQTAWRTTEKRVELVAWHNVYNTKQFVAMTFTFDRTIDRYPYAVVNCDQTMKWASNTEDFMKEIKKYTGYFPGFRDLFKHIRTEDYKCLCAGFLRQSESIPQG